jgi:ribose 5-phosphate isomerase RpiB
MRIAVVSEISTTQRNEDLISALSGRGHDVLNLGMKGLDQSPELRIEHTGFIGALALNTARADLVVGGCGTGQGFAISVSQYPGVVCGHIASPLDAWLFPQINDGNCVSLQLNQGYGWGADVNLRLIFDALFSVERGRGYPPHRQVPQLAIRGQLAEVARVCHRSMADVVRSLPDEIIGRALTFPGVWETIDVATLPDRPLAEALQLRWSGAQAAAPAG